MHPRLEQQLAKYLGSDGANTPMPKEFLDAVSQTYADQDNELAKSEGREQDRDEFFSIASHELRTPLTAISGNASMLLEYYGDKIVDADMKQMIEDIQSSSKRLIRIVNDFLDVSRLEQGRMVFHCEVFDICTIAEETKTELLEIVAEKHIGLRFPVRDGMCLPVFADPARTKQVVMNLLGNAINYTSQGEVVVGLEILDGFLKVLIKDTGIGVSPEQQPLLFRKFQQAEGGTDVLRNKTSTGLGLYISKLIVEGMGGVIAIEESVPGKGSTFSFTLPLAPEEMQPEVVEIPQS